MNRDEKVELVDGKIEHNLELIGSTAIEDRLQDNVADTIKFMKSTGIKVWVLTGDKIETAKNIGVSAGLLDSSMVQHDIDIIDEYDMKEVLQKLNKQVQENKRLQKKQAIIVAGSNLAWID